jgi:hypothetical protein
VDYAIFSDVIILADDPLASDVGPNDPPLAFSNFGYVTFFRVRDCRDQTFFTIRFSALRSSGRN